MMTTDTWGRRIGVSLFLRGSDGSLLLESKHAEEPWGLPGGWAGPDEDAHDAALRTVRETTGLETTPGVLLAVHRTPGSGTVPESYHLVFDGGEVEIRGRLRFLPGVRTYQLVPPGELEKYVGPTTLARLHRCLETLDGEPVTYRSDSPAGRGDAA